MDPLILENEHSVEDDVETEPWDHVLVNFQTMLDRIEKDGYASSMGEQSMEIYSEAFRQGFCEFKPEDILKRREIVEKLMKFDITESIPVLEQTKNIDYQSQLAMWALSGALLLHEHYPDLTEQLVNSTQVKALQEQFDLLRSTEAEFRTYCVYANFKKMYRKSGGHRHCDLWKGVTKIIGIDIETWRQEEQAKKRKYEKENESEPLDEDTKRLIYDNFLKEYQTATDRIELIGFDDELVRTAIESYGTIRKYKYLTEDQLKTIGPFIEKLAHLFIRVIPQLESTVIGYVMNRAMHLLSSIRYLADDYPELMDELVNSEPVKAMEQYFDCLRKNRFRFENFESFYMCKEDYVILPKSHHWHNLWESVTEINGNDIETATRLFKEETEKVMLGDDCKKRKRPWPADANLMTFYDFCYDSDDSDHPDHVEEMKNWDRLEETGSE